MVAINCFINLSQHFHSVLKLCVRVLCFYYELPTEANRYIFLKRFLMNLAYVNQVLKSFKMDSLVLCDLSSSGGKACSVCQMRGRRNGGVPGPYGLPLCSFLPPPNPTPGIISQVTVGSEHHCRPGMRAKGTVFHQLPVQQLGVTQAPEGQGL